MLFEWDEAERLANLEEHGVDFRDAALIFENATLEAADARSDYGETRVRALGHIDGDFFLVVYTWRQSGAERGRDDIRRIISAWKVGEDGQKRYRAILGG